MVADSVDVGRSPVGGIGMDGLGVWTEFLVKVTGNEDKSIAENHWLRLTPSVALLRGQVRSSLGIRCQQQQLVDWTCRSNHIFPATDLASLSCTVAAVSPQ